MKRVLSLLLVAAMLLAIPVMPISAKAAEANITDPTSDCPCCGVPMDELTWIPWDASVGGTPPSGHYYLAGDYNQSSVKTIMAGNHVVLDLRGYTWSSYAGMEHNSLSYHRMMGIQGYFYLMDTVGGGLVETEIRSNYGGAFYLTVNEHDWPKFHMLSGTMRPRNGEKNYKPGGAIYVPSLCEFKMTGGCITGYQTVYQEGGKYSDTVAAANINGGAIMGAANSKILIHGGTIMNCSASSYGGAIHSAGTVELKNCTLTGNVAGRLAGNVSMAGGTLTVENALIENGSGNCVGIKDYGGGNIFGKSNAVIDISDSVIRNGYCGLRGGNIYTDNGCTLTLKNTEVTAGVAQRNGGNICAYKTTNTFDNLTSNGDIIVEGGTLTLKNDTKIGLNSTGLMLRSAPTVTASALTSGAEIYVGTAGNATVAAAGANIDYFKPAYRTVLAGGNGAAITASLAASGTLGGYCPHCLDKGEKVTWTAYTGQTTTGHYYLTANRTNSLQVNETEDIVIDLNAYTWSSAAGRVFTNKGKLALMDSNTAAAWTSAAGWSGSAVIGVGSNNYNGGVVHNNGTFALYGGTLRYQKKDDCVVKRGGVVYNLETTSKMYMYGGVLDGSAYNNTDAENGMGGAFYQRYNSQFTMTAGRMIGGTAYAGGTAGFEGNVTVNITGGSFSGGTSTSVDNDYSGGNLYFAGGDNTGSVQVSNVSVTGGSAALSGGNIYLGRYATNIFDNCYIAGGKATGSSGYGGNMVAYKASNVELKNSILLSGSAVRGGNFYVASSGAAPKLTDCLITCGYTTSTDNGSNGGNLYFNNGNPVIQGGEISLGRAGHLGGNVYIYTGIYVDGNKTTFQKSPITQDEPRILGGMAKYGGNLSIIGVAVLQDAHISHGKVSVVGGAGKDIQFTGDKARLTVGSGVTGDISMSVKGSPKYGQEIPSITSTGIHDGLNLTLEHLADAPKAIYSDGKLYVARIATVNADGSLVWHKNEAAAVAASDENSYVKLYDNGTLNLTKDTYVDINGKKVTVSGSGTLLGMDSTGDGYGLPTGRVTSLGENGVKEKSLIHAPNGNKYVALKEDDGTFSFHRLGIDLTTVTIDVDNNGVYFKGKFGADETLKPMIDTYGIAVSLDGMPKAEEIDKTIKSVFSGSELKNGESASGVIITNILKDTLDPVENKNRGEKRIHATAYVTLKDAEGTTYVSNTEKDDVAWSLRDTLVRLNELIKDDPTNFRKYTNTMREYYKQWQDSIGDWLGEGNSFVTPEKDDTIDILMIGSSFCTYYVEELSLIAEAAGVPVRVCNVYYSGCPLEKYYNDWKNGIASYQFYSTVDGKRTGASGSKTLEWCLAQGEWDVISMQEYSGNVRNDTAEKHLEKTDKYTDALFPYITSQFPEAKFYFHQTWAFEKGYDRDADYKVKTPADQALAAWKQQEFALGLLAKYGDPETSGVTGSEFQCMDGRVPTGEAWQLVREGFKEYEKYDKLCVRTGTTNNAGDKYHDGDLGGGQYLNALVWFFQIMKDRGFNLTVEDIEWQPDNTTYGAQLADGLNLQQLKDCAWEAVYGNGWTYDAANYQ